MRQGVPGNARVLESTPSTADVSSTWFPSAARDFRQRSAYDRYIDDDKKMQQLYEEAVANFEMARQLYDLRKQSGLTQAQLAKSVGTSTSVISRLESADYNGHSLTMLRRIAAALGKQVEISFVEAGSERSGQNSESSS